MSFPPVPLGLGKARPYVMLLVGALHIGVLGALVPSGNAMGVPEPVAVILEREADTPADAAPAVADEPPAPAVVVPPPVPEPEVVPAPFLAAPAEVKEKPAVIVPKQAKITPPRVVPPKIVPLQKKREIAEREQEPRPRREVRQREPRAPAASAAPGEGRAQASAGRAAQAGAGGNSAAYAARVRATLQARANALGFEDVNATVVLSFSIDAAGRVNSASVARPSGDFKVDGALRRMLASASFPPPPGGRFSATVPVRIR